MCEIIAGQSEQEYACETRSVRIHGHSTSVRLESYFWRILDAIAVKEKAGTTTRLLNTLRDEVVEIHGQMTPNFASLLRTGCLKYLARNPDLSY
jgi:predicted DNA-binding ribbon-helix-helix protein